jgi:hypothetical protein
VRAFWALLAVAVGPFLVLDRRRAALVAAFVPTFFLLVANPLSGKLLYASVPAVFWRFAYLLPVPLCAGLIVAGVANALASVPRRARLLCVGVATVFCVVFAVSMSLTTVSPGNLGFSWKSPTAWKLDQATLGALDPWLPELRGRNVLTDEPTAVTLSLADPSVRTLCHRPQTTLLSFALDERLDDGLARVGAQRIVAGASDAPADVAAFEEVADDADAVLARNPAAPLVRSVLEKDTRWREAGSDTSFTLFLRD